MLKNFKRSWGGLLALALLLAACRSAPAETSPTPQPDTVLTAAAQTAQAHLTETAQPTATPEATPTATSAPETPTVSPSVTPTLDLAVTPTTAVFATPPTSSSGDLANWVADVTVPDYTDVAPGEAFTKTWRLRNDGTTTWTTDYSLAFFGGAQLGGPASVNVPEEVAPGEEVDISVDLVAATEAGTYQGFWKMRNAAGEFFDYAVFVIVDVVGGTGSGAGTPPASGDGTASEAVLVVDEAAPEECPYTFSFTATFTLSEASTVRYRLEAGSDTAGFEFDLPGEQSDTFAAGTHSVTYTLDISDSVSGWAQFHILSPNDLLSNQATFELTCGS